MFGSLGFPNICGLWVPQLIPPGPLPPLAKQHRGTHLGPAHGSPPQSFAEQLRFSSGGGGAGLGGSNTPPDPDLLAGKSEI